MTRGKRAVAVAALIALALALIPVFQSNILAPGDSYYFTNWDRRSQSLVIAKIAQDVTQGSQTPFGLTAANPDPLGAYDAFDALQFGAVPATTSYSPYASSLGLQGYAFEGLYRAGCRTTNCLTTAESTAFALVFVLLCTLLALAVRRSVGLVLLFSSLVSPWIVSSAHNLYWVPWSWLLPACAAAAAVLARERRWRLGWVAVAGVATGVKAAMGYEYLSATTLLAASIPVLAFLIGGRGAPRRALWTALQIVVACSIGFLVVLLIHLFVAGAGSFSSGLPVVWDAVRRTLGSGGLDAAPLVNASSQASVLSVLWRYAFGWSAALFALGVGGPYPSIAIGSGGFWVLTAVCGTVVVLDLIRRRAGAGRIALVLLVAAAPPLSWYVLATSHSSAETDEDYVLWYLIFIPTMVWILLHRASDSAIGRAFRRLPSSPPRLPRRTDEAGIE